MEQAPTTPLARGLHRLAAGLEAAFDASKAIHHNLAAGEARERAVAHELAPHFPSRFRLSSGIVVNATGQESRQQDVLITDPSIGTPFVAEGNIGVHPVETVAASLQIKTTLDRREVRDAVDNIASLKALVADAPRGYARLSGSALVMGETSTKPFGGIVAFQASSSNESIRRAYLEANAQHPLGNRTNILFVLDRFTTIWSAGEQPLTVTENPSHDGRAQTIEAGRDTILFFYIILMRFLNAYVPPALDLTAYVNGNLPTLRLYWDRIAQTPDSSDS